jgi:anti-anti-sigma factor
MQVTRQDRDDCAVLVLTGEFDSFETGLVREGLEGCLAQGRTRIVLDLGPMSFANSTTIAYLITAQKRAQEAGGRIALARPQDFILKTLKTLGLQQVFPILDSVEAAIASLRDA